MRTEPDPSIADLDLSFDPAAVSRADVVTVLRELGIVGLLSPEVESGSRALHLMLGFVTGRGVLVSSPATGEIDPTEPHRLVDTIAARVSRAAGGAAVEVFLDTEDGSFEAESGASLDREGDAAPLVPVRQVFIVAGDLNLAPDRRAEFALQLGSSFTAIPLGTRTLILPDEVVEATWFRAQRPVTELRLTESEFLVRAFSVEATKRGRVRDRLTMVADWMGLWSAAPVSVPDLTNAAPGETSTPTVELQTVLRRRVREMREEIDVPEALRTEFHADLAEIRRLQADDLTDETVDRVVAALRLPSETATVLRAEEAEDTFTGAFHVERLSVKDTVLESALAPPTGDGWWARYRRIPHRSPGLAATLIAVEFLLAVLVAAVAMTAGLSAPWPVLLWILAGILVVDAASDTFLLARLRRRAGA